MNIIEEITTPEVQEEPDQKWAEPFAELLDQIYYPGYAVSLAEENSEAYHREYFYFLSVYQ